MKKFGELVNEKIDHYSADQKTNNDLYKLIDECLNTKMNGSLNENLSLVGKEELVKEISKIVENEVNKYKAKLLQSYINNPISLQETITKDNELENLVAEASKKECDCKVIKDEESEKCECGKDKKECDCNKDKKECDCKK